MERVTRPLTVVTRADPDALRMALEPARQAVRAGTLPGAVVAIADSHGELLLEPLAGPRSKGIRPDGLFFLASVTKPIVAAAVMRLVDAGRVDLRAPIQRYVPAFSGAGKDRVTVWHILTHTSGIPDQDAEVLRRERPSAGRMFDLVCLAALRFEPGTRYEYCSSSFYLLAELLARQTGRPFPAALRELVTGPAGMVDTSFDPRHDRRRIVPVEGVPLRNWIARELLLRFLVRASLPGGGLWGTARDLVRFGRALLPSVAARGEGLLSPAALDEMTREQTVGIPELLADGGTREPRYALGWGKPNRDGTVPTVVGKGTPPLGQAREVRPVTALIRGNGRAPVVPASPGTFTHGGATGTRIWVDPDRDLVFVFMTNLWDADDGPMFSTLARIYEVVDAAAARSMGMLTMEPHSVHEPS